MAAAPPWPGFVVCENAGHFYAPAEQRKAAARESWQRGAENPVRPSASAGRREVSHILQSTFVWCVVLQLVGQRLSKNEKQVNNKREEAAERECCAISAANGTFSFLGRPLDIVFATRILRADHLLRIIRTRGERTPKERKQRIKR